MKYKDAVRLRRRYERTICAIKHLQHCLFSDGTIIPIYPCTCGSKEKEYYNVMIVPRNSISVGK